MTTDDKYNIYNLHFLFGNINRVIRVFDDNKIVNSITEEQVKKYFCCYDNGPINYKQPPDYVDKFNNNMVELCIELINQTNFKPNKTLLHDFKHNDVNVDDTGNIFISLFLGDTLTRRERHLLYRLASTTLIDPYSYGYEQHSGSCSGRIMELHISPNIFKEIFEKYYNIYARRVCASAKIRHTFRSCYYNPNHPFGLRRLQREIRVMSISTVDDLQEFVDNHLYHPADIHYLAREIGNIELN